MYCCCTYASTFAGLADVYDSYRTCIHSGAVVVRSSKKDHTVTYEETITLRMRTSTHNAYSSAVRDAAVYTAVLVLRPVSCTVLPYAGAHTGTSIKYVLGTWYVWYDTRSSFSYWHV